MKKILIGLFVTSAIGVAVTCQSTGYQETTGESDIDSDSDSDVDGDSDGDGDGDSDGDGDGDSDSDSSNSCRFVDVVIAVDPSTSMQDELVAMREEVFPAFAEQLGEISEGLDNFRIATLDACPDPANFHTRGVQGECNFYGGNPWIDSDSPNMNDEFACVGDIYIDDYNCSGDNDDEQPASAAATSLEIPFLNEENAGFLRDDGILVIVSITDEDEHPTSEAETAEEIYDRIVAIKGGDVSWIVFLGIGGTVACSGVYGDAEEATLLKQITDLFIAQDRGVWWDLCEGNLEDGLDEAFAVIEEACDEIPPI